MITMLRTTLPVQCPACRDHLGKGPAVGRCPTCGTPHHEACLEEIGCASLQCKPGGTLPGTGEDTTSTLDLNGTNVIVLSTLGDLDNTYGHREPCIVYISDWYFVVTNLESGLEEVAQWCSENAPGLLTEPDYPEMADGRSDGVCVDCADAIPNGSGPCEHVNEAEEDLTYCDPGLWIASEDWTCRDLSPAEMHQVRCHLFEQEVRESEHDIGLDLRNYRLEAIDCGGEDCTGPLTPGVNSGTVAHDEETCPYGGSIDIRLQVDSDGTWYLHSGSPDYDTDHSGYWGSSSLNGAETDADLFEMARDLIGQVINAYAEGGD